MGEGRGGGWGVGGDSCLVGSMSISPLFAQLAIVYCKIILLRQEKGIYSTLTYDILYVLLLYRALFNFLCKVLFLQIV
jgi:hypothetical protein